MWLVYQTLETPTQPEFTALWISERGNLKIICEMVCEKNEYRLKPSTLKGMSETMLSKFEKSFRKSTQKAPCKDYCPCHLVPWPGATISLGFIG